MFILAAQKTAVLSRPEVEVGRDGGREQEVRGAARGALGGGRLAGIGGAERGGRLLPARVFSRCLNFEVRFAEFFLVFLETTKKTTSIF